jgi:hypothetical protein
LDEAGLMNLLQSANSPETHATKSPQSASDENDKPQATLF